MYGGNPSLNQTFAFNQESLDYFNRLSDKIAECGNDGFPCDKCPLAERCWHFWTNRICTQLKISPYQFAGFSRQISKLQTEKWWTVLALVFPIKRRKRKKRLVAVG